MNIVFFTHYFPPEGNAPASRTYEHCKRWVESGHRVSVITSAPNVPNGIVYEGYSNRLWPQREELDGIEVVRVWTLIAPNSGSVRRILNYVSYMFSAVFAFLFFCRRPDVIIATSPQFFCGWAGIISSYLKWSPLVIEIRDIWPESIVTVGAMKKGPLLSILEFLEKYMYRLANHIVVVTHGMKNQILDKVDVRNKISVVTNGVDLDQFPKREKDRVFLRQFNLQDRFVCGYVGTIGMAHRLDVVLDAAEIFREKSDYRAAFLLVGDGADRARLESECEKRNLGDWVIFAGRLAKNQMPTVLASTDALLIHLKNSKLFKSAIPSKVFEAMAMERPILVGVEGEVAKIVNHSKAGFSFEPENGVSLANSVLELIDQPDRHTNLSKHGREFVSKNYSREVLAMKMLEDIKKVVK